MVHKGWSGWAAALCLVFVAGCLPEIRVVPSDAAPDSDATADGAATDVVVADGGDASMDAHTDGGALDAEVAPIDVPSTVDAADGGVDAMDVQAIVDSPDVRDGVATEGGSDVVDAGDVVDAADVVAAPQAPLLVAPYAGANVTGRRPTMRWVNRGGEGAEIEFCDARDCATVVDTVRAMGTETTLTRSLPVGVVFWRARAVRGGQVGSEVSATGQFTVVPSAAQRSCAYGVHLDLNGDGFDDVVRITSNGLEWFAGSRSGLSMQATTIATPGFAPSQPVAPGDFDGDGLIDLAVVDRARLVVAVLRGGSTPRWDDTSSAGPFPDTQSGTAKIASAGDFDGDGVADLVYYVNGGLDVRVLFGVRPSAAGARFRFVDRPWEHGRTGASMLGGPVALTNVDGDAYSDVVLNIGSDVAMLQGGTREQIRGRTFSSYSTNLLSMGDQNGDGVPDLLAYIGGPIQQAAVYRSLDSLLRNAPDEMAPHPMEARFATPGDLNADGFADFVYAQRSGGWQVLLGTASGFRALPASLGGNTFEGRSTIFAPGTLDSNGDGVFEVFARLVSTTTRTEIWRWGEAQPHWIGPTEAGFE